jgi:hypothetical protein
MVRATAVLCFMVSPLDGWLWELLLGRERFWNDGVGGLALALALHERVDKRDALAWISHAWGADWNPQHRWPAVMRIRCSAESTGAVVEGETWVALRAVRVVALEGGVRRPALHALARLRSPVL